MSFVKADKTTWRWHADRGILVVSRRSKDYWATHIDADIAPIESATTEPKEPYYKLQMPGWQLQLLLNQAYERGRAEALEDLRGLT